MYRLIFRLPVAREKSIVAELRKAGVTDFYTETGGGITMLHLFAQSQDIPWPLHDLAPESVSEITEDSWNDNWAAGYTGHELTRNIYVRASGTPLPEKAYRYIIQIYPGKSFGDGNHPTTRLCGQLVEGFLAGDKWPDLHSMLDIGTGSGILAIAARLMGVQDIELFDNDEQSILVAEKNIALNGITGIKPYVADLRTWQNTRGYDIITANLLTGLIENTIHIIARAMKPDGILIISGISKKWTGTATKLFKRNNLVIVEHKKLEDWNGFLLKRKR